MEDDRVAILESQLAQAKLIAEEADKKYEEVLAHDGNGNRERARSAFSKSPMRAERRVSGSFRDDR